MNYTENEMLPLSGIQHFAFCPRQWALIDIEQQWEDNILTVEGTQLHERVDNPFYRIKRGDVITLRRVPIVSFSLGLNGFSDIVELIASETNDNAIQHPRYPGYWKPFPVEYKHGKTKPNRCDEVQVAAQAICLEEMYGILIPEGRIFYNEEKGRQTVIIDEGLRELTHQYADEMHRIFKSGHTPKAVQKRHCRRCSLIDLCIPQLSKIQDAKDYLKKNLYEETFEYTVSYNT